MKYVSIVLATCVAYGTHVTNTYAQTEGGKGTVSIISGTSIGSGNELYARLIARHLGKYLPGNPSVVIREMEGAGGRRAAEYIALRAPLDGSEIGAIQPEAILAPVYTPETVRYTTAMFAALGSALTGHQICLTVPRSSVRTFEDTSRKPVVMGATGVGGGTYNIAHMIRALTNRDPTLFKIVHGYKASIQELFLAGERGEIDGACGIELTTAITLRPEWFSREPKAHILLQTGVVSHLSIPGFGVISDMRDFMTQEQREVAEFIVSEQLLSRPYFVPVRTAPERLKVLRTAFMATLHDTAFIAEVSKANLTLSLVPHERVDAALEKFASAPSELVARAAAAMK